VTRSTRRARRLLRDRFFIGLAIGASILSIVALGWLLTTTFRQGSAELLGSDDGIYEELRAGRAPEELADFAEVDWRELAEEHKAPVLAALSRATWSALAEVPALDAMGRLNFESLGLAPADARALAALDWSLLAPSIRVDRRSAISARWEATRFHSFITDPPSRHPKKAGIGPAMMGTIWLCIVCAVMALPIGVATAVYLEEYKPRRAWSKRFHGFIQLNITNLAGVPSIVYGILGLTVFANMFGLLGNPQDPIWTLGNSEDWYYVQIPFGRGVVAGGLTLMLVVLPIVIISSQEALRAVPDSLRQGALALGATRWQMIRRMTLPGAVPGIMTGAILAMSRAIGEAAPVLVICGIVFIRFTPSHLMDEFTAMPLQIFEWTNRPQEDFHRIAASGIIVLLAVLLVFNSLAIFIRQKFQRPLQ